MRAARSLAWVALAAAVPPVAALGAAGCDRDERPRYVPSEQAAPVESLARAVGADAAALEAPLDPPAPAGDFHEEVAAFTTLDRCAAQHAAVDPLVGDALSAIGYDTFLRDACRVLEAAKAGDDKRCDPIESSSLRARCQATVAELRGTPERCPLVFASEPERGRDPTCVAVASRDPRLCAGAEDDDAVRCVALVTRDAKACAKARVPSERTACARVVERLRTSLPDPPASLPALAKPAGTLTLHGVGGAPDPKPGTFDLAAEVARGVVLVREPLGARVRVGSLVDLGVVPHVVSPTASARLGLEIVMPDAVGGGAKGPGAAAPPRLDRAELDIPGAIALATDGLARSLHVTVDALDASRGGTLRLHVEGESGAGAASYRVRAEVTTFVRDVVGGDATTRTR